MWLRVVALLLNVIFGLALPVQAAETAAPRRVDGPVADPADPHRPAETPPPDFPGLQYIDSAGCVFLRTESGWRARLARDGSAICGWPPTLSARGTQGVSPASGAGSRASQIEQTLAEAIIPNLQSGELAERPDETPPPLSELAAQASGRATGDALDPAPDPLGLGQMVASAPDLRRQLVGTGHAQRLCGLIGAGDALGLCGPADEGAALALPRASGSEPASARVATAVPGSLPGPATPVAAPAAPRARPSAAALPATASSAASASKAAVTVPAASRPAAGAGAGADNSMLIRPGMRYVEVGTFKDPDQALAVARQLAAMGLPVVRSKPREGAAIAVMVGPLEDREAIVRMADRLRKAGFARLVAR